MTEGLQIQLTGTELKKLYQTKAQWCWDQLTRCQEIRAYLMEQNKLIPDTGEVDRDFFSDSIHHEIRDKKRAWEYYSFLAAHVNESEVYNFKKDQLGDLGVKL